MESNRFFLTVNRINAVLILLLAIGASFATVSLLIASKDWRSEHSAPIVDNNAEEKIDLHLGNLEEMKGHEIQTVNLISARSSRGLSSGSGGYDIRNVLFLSGPDLQAHWLYDANNFLINCFCKLQASNQYDAEDPVLAVYVPVIKQDTNRDGKLSDDDGIALALVRPDGSDYLEVETGIRKVLDSTVTDHGESVTFLLHAGSAVVAKKYSLVTFELLSERRISDVRETL